MHAAAKSLPGEHDDNFHLTASSGSEGWRSDGFVLKVMHPAREASLIDLQCRALQHLAQRAPQLTLPRVCPTRGGENFTLVTAADGSSRLVWLLTYVSGTGLGEAEPLRAAAEGVGGYRSEEHTSELQ